MFGQLKYIVDENGNFMVFSPTIHHRTAEKSSYYHTRAKCIGAGFVSFGNRTVSCFGRSESLNINSNGIEDAKIIAAGMHFVAHE